MRLGINRAIKLINEINLITPVEITTYTFVDSVRDVIDNWTITN